MISPSKVNPHHWVPVSSDPELSAEAADLARKIAGEGASADLLARARDVAEIEIDQRRVDQVQYEWSSRLPGSQLFMDLVIAAKRTRVKSSGRSMILAIDRYDRRTLSRRKTAIRAFDAASRNQKVDCDFGKTNPIWPMSRSPRVRPKTAVAEGLRE